MGWFVTEMDIEICKFHTSSLELLIVYYRVKLSAPLGNYLNDEFKVITNFSIVCSL